MDTTQFAASSPLAARQTPASKSSVDERDADAPSLGSQAIMTEVTDDSWPDSDDPLEALRAILLGHYRVQAQDLEAELTQVQAVITALDARINDKAALIDTITPIIAQSIRTSIRDSRGEMIEALHPIMADAIQSSIRDSRESMVEALYPIMGRLVQRAVTEAMRDLARSIDHQMRNAFSFRAVSRRIVARAGGLSEAELAIRDALPFVVDEIFLIHRESGLLLRYLEFDSANAAVAETRVADLTVAATALDAQSAPEEDGPLNDSDLISGMLTAIRDFAADALGRGEEGQLDEVQFGEKSILIEAAPHVYMAVVVRGIEPRAFRTKIREQVYAIEERFLPELRTYRGDPAPFATVSNELYGLAASVQPHDRPASRPDRPIPWSQIWGSLWLVILLVLGVLLLGWGFIQSLL